MKGPIARVLGEGGSPLLRGWELALRNRILHSTAAQIEAPGQGCPCPEKGAAGAHPRVASVPLGHAKSSFPSPPIPSIQGCLLPLQSLLLLLWSKCQSHSVCLVRLSRTALYPRASLAVTPVWVSFGPSSTQLLEGVGYVEYWWASLEVWV